MILVKIFIRINSKLLYCVHLIYNYGKRVVYMKSMIKKLRDLREDNDLTQEAVAKILGTSQTMYARYERGANELPVRHLKKLCEYYNVSADFLLGIRTDTKKK